MHCTVCLQKRYKAEWRDSQWKKNSQNVNGYDRCKPCQKAGMTHNDLLEYRCIRELLAIEIEDFGSNQNEFLKEFDEWVKGQRKSLSHRGALVVRKESDPVCWTDETSGLKYFDPTNEVYRAAYNAVAPQPNDRKWTANETVGDVIESMLGLCWETRRGKSLEEANAVLAHPWPRSGVSLLNAERFWNIVVYMVWRLRFFETLSC